MISGVMVPMVLLVPLSVTFVMFHMIIGALRVRFRLILVCGKIICLCRIVCAHASVCIISLGELMILVPGVRQRLTLQVPVISIDLNSSILKSILSMRTLIKVNFKALQRNNDIL